MLEHSFTEKVFSYFFSVFFSCLLEHIKKLHKGIVTIMLTNYPINQFRKKCFDAGADFFFDKSTEFEKVFCVIKSMINGNGKC